MLAFFILSRLVLYACDILSHDMQTEDDVQSPYDWLGVPNHLNHRSWDKSKNPYLYPNHIYPNSVHH